jgi:voltage-gated potassium channel
MIGLAALALFLIFLSVAVHAVVVARMMARLIQSTHLRVLNVFRAHALLLFLVFTVLLASHLVQALLWAVAYYAVGGFDDLATSLYFSLSSYTTVGYADVVLPQNMRLLGPLEAATGVLMFGWSTGYIFALATRMLAAQQSTH